MNPESVAIALGVGGFVLGGGGLTTFMILAYRTGRWTSKLDAIEKTMNGPLQKQFDSVKERDEETRELASKVYEAFNERTEMCASHDAGIESLKGSVAKIEEHIGGQRCVGHNKREESDG